MRRALLITTLLVGGTVLGLNVATGLQPEPIEPPTRFEAVHLFVDSADTPLSAYQVQLDDAHGRVQVVGVENGEHAAFGAAPFYDRTAVNQRRADRIIIAAYSTLAPEQLPTGRTRLATVHLRVTGEAPVEYRTQLIAAADAAGVPIAARLTFQVQRGSQP